MRPSGPRSPKGLRPGELGWARREVALEGEVALTGSGLFLPLADHGGPSPIDPEAHKTIATGRERAAASRHHEHESVRSCDAGRQHPRVESGLC